MDGGLRACITDSKYHFNASNQSTKDPRGMERHPSSLFQTCPSPQNIIMYLKILKQPNQMPFKLYIISMLLQDLLSSSHFFGLGQISEENRCGEVGWMLKANNSTVDIRLSTFSLSESHRCPFYQRSNRDGGSIEAFWGCCCAEYCICMHDDLTQGIKKKRSSLRPTINHR